MTDRINVEIQSDPELDYSFTDFNTDTAAREDYQENVGMLTISMTPSSPVRFPSSTPRTALENRLFGQ